MSKIKNKNLKLISTHVILLNKNLAIGYGKE